MKDLRNNLYPNWATESEKKALQEGLIYADLNEPAKSIMKDFSNFNYPKRVREIEHFFNNAIFKNEDNKRIATQLLNKIKEECRKKSNNLNGVLDELVMLNYYIFYCGETRRIKFYYSSIVSDTDFIEDDIVLNVNVLNRKRS